MFDIDLSKKSRSTKIYSRYLKRKWFGIDNFAILHILENIGVSAENRRQFGRAENISLLTPDQKTTATKSRNQRLA